MRGMALAYIDPKTGYGMVQVVEFTSFIDGKKKVAKKRPTALILMGGKGAKGMQKVFLKIAPLIVDKIKRLEPDAVTLEEVIADVKRGEIELPATVKLINPRKLKELVKKVHDLAKEEGLEVGIKYTNLNGKNVAKWVMTSAEPEEYVNLLSEKELREAVEKIKIESIKVTGGKVEVKTGRRE